MKKEQNLWTREELILALNLYLKLPFGKLDKRTPEVKHLAKLINRTDNAVSMRLNNFASVDPYHQQRGIRGLEGGRKQVQPIWDEFINNKEELLFESERILAEREKIKLEKKYEDVLRGTEGLKGLDKIREVKTRINQDVFREIVIANYEGRCAITKIDIPELLLASHIIPWSKNEQERLNPENGICFCSLYDRAFDKGLLAVTPTYKVVLSPLIKKKSKEEYYKKYFLPVEGFQIVPPKKYQPKREFLEYHLDNIFKRK